MENKRRTEIRFGVLFTAILICVSLLFVFTNSLMAYDSKELKQDNLSIATRQNPKRDIDRERDPDKVRTPPDKEKSGSRNKKKPSKKRVRKNLKIEVTGLDARIESFKVPYGGKNVNTGTISIDLGNSSQLPVSAKTQLNPKVGKGRIVWPVELNSPLLDEMGQGQLQTFFIGTFSSVGNGGFVSVDVGNIVLPSGDITVININGNPPDDDDDEDDDGDEEDPEEEPSEEITGAFYDLPESFINQYILPTLEQDIKAALNMWNNVSRNDVNINPALIRQAVESYQGNSPNELVIYSATTNSFETADLTGNFVISMWWDLDRMG